MLVLRYTMNCVEHRMVSSRRLLNVCRQIRQSAEKKEYVEGKRSYLRIRTFVGSFNPGIRPGPFPHIRTPDLWEILATNRISTRMQQENCHQ